MPKAGKPKGGKRTGTAPIGAIVRVTTSKKDTPAKKQSITVRSKQDVLLYSDEGSLAVLFKDGVPTPKGRLLWADRGVPLRIGPLMPAGRKRKGKSSSYRFGLLLTTDEAEYSVDPVLIIEDRAPSRLVGPDDGSDDGPDVTDCYTWSVLAGKE